MHDARDAADKRLLEAGEYARLVESYYGVIVKRCQARTKSDEQAFDVAGDVVIRLLGELKAGKRYTVPFRVVVHKVIGWKLAEHFTGRSQEAELGDDVAAHVSGRRPDVRQFLLRAGSESQELGLLIDRYLEVAPVEEPDEETVVALNARLEHLTPLTAARRRLPLRVDDVVERLRELL